VIKIRAFIKRLPRIGFVLIILPASFRHRFYCLTVLCVVAGAAASDPAAARASVAGDNVEAEAAASRSTSGPDCSRPGSETKPLQFAQAAPARSDASAAATSIGAVSTLQGSASVTRNGASTALKLQDDIFKGDILKTGSGSSLGVTFDDETTFNLTANASVVVDDFVYQEGGSKNAAAFKVMQGTVAFVASAVAKTGNMTMTTPTANLGIRGTTGLVEVGRGASPVAPGASGNDAIKLYPDADGKVGRIEITARDGTSLGVLSRGATGFSIQRGAGARMIATPLLISPQQAARDQGIVRQVHAAQQLGRSIVAERRTTRLLGPPRQPAIQRQPALPRQPAVPHQPGLQKPALPNRAMRPPAIPKPPLLRPHPAPRRLPALQPKTKKRS
jgi:hypothetical protein